MYNITKLINFFVQVVLLKSSCTLCFPVVIQQAFKQASKCSRLSHSSLKVGNIRNAFKPDPVTGFSHKIENVIYGLFK